MGFLRRKKSKAYSASGSRMIVPGLGILTANIQSVDKIVIKPNQRVGNVLPTPTPTPEPTPTPNPYTITAGVTTTTDNQILSSFRFDVLEGTSTDISIDWGDNSTIEYGSISSITNFPHTYEFAGNYIIGIIFSNPENVYEIRINQND